MSTLLDDAFALKCSLVIDDNRRWGDAANEVQLTDTRAVLDPASPTPYHWLGRARGYDKTAGLAGDAVAIMLTQAPAGSKLYCVASDRDQGRLVVDSVQGYMARTPELRGALVVDQFKVTASRTRTTLEVLAADAPSAYGLRPYFLGIDELHQWASTEQPQRLLDATTSALPKVPGARCVVITSAGDPSHWTYKVLIHAHRDPLWRVHLVSGPAPWISPELLAEQRNRLLPSLYARFFENRPMASEGRLTSPADVLACIGHAGDLAYEAAGYSYVVTLDVGLTNDRTAAVVAHGERRDGELVVVVDRLQVWQGSRDRPVELSVVEAWVAEAARSYHAPLLFDPYQAAHLAQRLRTRNIRVIEFTFTQASTGRLAVTLYRLLRDGALDLPDDEALVDELAAVKLVERSPGSFRLDHGPHDHDDMAVAVAMAASWLVEHGRPADAGSGIDLWLGTVQPSTEPDVEQMLREVPSSPW